jgi:hypothetical protein
MESKKTPLTRSAQKKGRGYGPCFVGLGKEFYYNGEKERNLEKV